MIPGSANPLLLAAAAEEAAGYQISRSLRFNSSDSAYCSRVPSLAGDREKYTFSAWTKRSSLSAQAGVFECSPNSNENTGIYFTSSNELRLQLRVFGSYNLLWTTTAIYRDTAAWYHIVVSVDTGQVSTANAVKIYVNGVEQAATYTAASGSYSQNMNTGINSTSSHHIGYQLDGANYFNGYLADIHFIDGQTPSVALDSDGSVTGIVAAEYLLDFGEFDANGIWQPKEYTGSYGTNGFHLPFSDNSTAAALGTDTSGNSNTWTVNNISVTAGAGNDSLVDSPTNGDQEDTGAGGEVVGNYATLNSVSVVGNDPALRNGNLSFSGTYSGRTSYISTIASDKFYYEAVFDVASGNGPLIGVLGTTQTQGDRPGQNDDGYTWRATAGSFYINGSNQGSYGSYTGDGTNIIGVAVDSTAGTLEFFVNGTSQGTATSSLPSGKYFATVADGGNTSELTDCTVNFGQRPFAYTAPSGFKALCTTNLDDPLVAKPSEYMDVALYTGNGSTQTISGLEFSPDLVWIKNRAAADSHKLTDTVRGATEELESDTTAAEATNADGLTQFNSDGFDLGADAEYNTNTEAYVAWTWDAGSSTVSNTDGSITSQVRANPSAGFSIVTYTGNGSAGATIGHGLGVAPQMIIVKNRDAADAWQVYHSANTANPETDYLVLNTTAATADNINRWNDTAPTSTVFSLGDGVEVNTNTEDYVAYCWTGLVGYSSFGSYTGNGSTNGPFVYTGFRPRWLLIKSSSGAAENWVLIDSARDTYNVAGTYLRPNLSNAEASSIPVDFLSNGFKLRGSSGTNQSAVTYVWAAFAENPFKTARAR